MSTSLNMNFPVGFRFRPTDLGLVRRYLRNKVDRNESEFIKTLNVYENDPWRLDHDPNPLFDQNEWYYFVPRTSAARTVRGKGESEGGTWKSTTFDKIEDHKKVVFGCKRSFVYNKKVKGKQVKTDWHMTEYSLNKDKVQDLVLCWIRDYGKNKDIVLPNYEVEKTEEERGDVNQQQQQQDQQEKDALILLPPPPPPLQSSDTNNVMMMSNLQEPYGFDGAEDVMIDIDEEEEEEKEEADFANKIEMMMLETERGDLNQQQQQQKQEQDALNLPPPPMQSNDTDNDRVSNQEPYGFDGAEDETMDIDELMKRLDDAEDETIDDLMETLDEGIRVTQQQLLCMENK